MPPKAHRLPQHLPVSFPKWLFFASAACSSRKRRVLWRKPASPAAAAPGGERPGRPRRPHTAPWLRHGRHAQPRPAPAPAVGEGREGAARHLPSAPPQRPLPSQRARDTGIMPIRMPPGGAVCLGGPLESVSSLASLYPTLIGR